MFASAIVRTEDPANALRRARSARRAVLNGDHRGDGDCAGTAQVVAAQRVARQLVLGFELCADSGVPLSELQKIALFSAALLEFDGLHAEVDGMLQIDRLIGELNHLDGPPSTNGA